MGFFTFVPSVEDLWEFVGSFEVEKRSHGKDQEQTEEKGPQNQGGGDFWAPWKLKIIIKTQKSLVWTKNSLLIKGLNKNEEQISDF